MEYNNDLEINDSGFDIGEEYSNIRSLKPDVNVDKVDAYYGKGSGVKDFLSNKDNVNSITSALGSIFGGGKNNTTPTPAPASNNNAMAQQMYLMQLEEQKRKNESKSSNTGMYIGIGVVSLLLITGITIAIVKK